MSGFMQGTFFFGYMAIVCFGFFLMLGTVGWRASLMFVRHIYKVALPALSLRILHKSHYPTALFKCTAQQCCRQKALKARCLLSLLGALLSTNVGAVQNPQGGLKLAGVRFSNRF